MRKEFPYPKTKHKVVCLIGSTKDKWREQYQKVNRELTLAGYVVLSVGAFKTDVEDIEKHRYLLESIHAQKINMSYAVVLIHEDAKGTHTKFEMRYCDYIEKPIVIFTNIEEMIKQLKEINGGKG